MRSIAANADLLNMGECRGVFCFSGSERKLTACP